MSKTLQIFKRETEKLTPSLKKFLKKFDKKRIPAIQPLIDIASEEAWEKTDCLDCAHCCKVMTPTFTPSDIKRIAAFLNMSPKAFYDKWLETDKDNGDKVNKTQPCQFLNLKDNKCSIYEVRPYDCSAFPHFNKKPFDDYNHIHEQNIAYCPATLTFVKKMKEQVEEQYEW
ncbi:MAG: YkgJ family cysteine cluster protein [Chitinophagaceae bacterium]